MTLQRFIERLIWLCMLPLILLGTVMLLVHVHTLEERRQMLADSVVRTAARNLDHMLEVQLASLQLLERLLDQSMVVRGGDLDRVQAYRVAKEFFELHGHHVVIGDSQERMLINTRVPLSEPLPALHQVEGCSAIAVALERAEPTVGDAFVGPLAGVPLVALAVPFNQRPGLAMMATIETEKFAQRLRSFKLPSGWVLRMVDGQNREMLRLSADHTEPNAKSFDTPWHTASLLRATWTVGLQAPPVSPLDDPMQRAFLMLGTLAATVGVAYWGGCIAARRLIHAMASLTQAVAVPRPSQDIDEIAQVRTELRRLARRREALREAEQRRIGLELHDDLQQKLALLRHEVDGLSQEAQARGDLPSADTAQRLERARGLVDETIESTRRLVQDLCPPILQDLGLPMALRVLAERHQAAHGQRVDLRVLSPLGWAGIPEETATVLYRVAQEALNNVRKHSGAHTVDMTLEREGDRAIVLEVCDDGVGYQASDLDPATTGNGLRSMRERVQALSGQIEWVSQPAEGCAILVRLPLNGELPAPSAEPAGDR